MESNKYQAVGKRKNSISRIVLVSNGVGNITINDKDFRKYFPNGIYCNLVLQPFVVTETLNKFDVIADISGGGITGHAESLRHAISLALIEKDEAHRATLRKAGFVTRDSRVKERKKYGLKGARKAPQFSKR